MGSIYGSVYPIDTIVLEGKGGYRNAMPQPTSRSTTAEMTIWKTVMDKYNIDTTKELSSMRAGELNLRKKKLKDALKVATLDLDKRWLNWELDNTNTRLREISSGTWGDIWGAIVNLSGVKTETDNTQTTTTTTTTPLFCPDGSPQNSDGTCTQKKSNKGLFIGIGVGVGVIALVVVAAVVIRKRNEKK